MGLVLDGFTPNSVESFEGLITLLQAEKVPSIASPNCQNVQYWPGSVGSRPGTSAKWDLGAGINDIYHAELFTQVAPLSVAGIVSPIHKYPLFISDTHDLYHLGKRAEAILTLAGPPYNNPADDDTVTIGGVAYTFKTVLVPATPRQVQINATSTITLDNLKACVNLEPSADGTKYSSGTVTPHPTAFMLPRFAYTLTAQARVAGAYYNCITVSKSSAVLSWSSTTLLGGDDQGCTRIQIINPSVTHFQVASLYDRAYLTFSNGLIGVAPPYYWSPSQGWSALCSVAGEDISSMVVTDGAFGGVTAGWHSFTIIYRTRTGFETISQDQVHFNAAGAKKITITGIPAHSNPNVVEMRVAMTQASLASFYDTDVIVSATGTATVDISDTELAACNNVDDYFAYMSPLHNAAGCLIYHNRLVLWGNDTATSALLFSEIDQPETFREDEGSISVAREDGQRVVTCFVIRDILYIVKERSIYATSDNGEVPSLWPLTLIANNLGTSSISGVWSRTDTEFALILDPKGLYSFDGRPGNKISRLITPTWLTISQGAVGAVAEAMATAEVHADLTNEMIYCLVPTGTDTRPSKIFMADIKEGVTKPKWCPWITISSLWRSIIIIEAEIILFNASGRYVRKFDNTAKDDSGSVITSYYEIGAIQPGKRNKAIHLAGGIGMCVEGAGNLDVVLYGLHHAWTKTPTLVVLEATPTKEPIRLVNRTSEWFTVRVGTNALTEWWVLNNLTLYTKPWQYRNG